MGHKTISTSVTSTTSGGPGKEGERLKALYVSFMVTWYEMGEKKSKIVAGQHAQESNWLKLLQHTAEANKTISKGFREGKVFSWKRNFSQSKLNHFIVFLWLLRTPNFDRVSHIRENQETFLCNNAVQLLPHGFRLPQVLLVESSLL